MMVHPVKRGFMNAMKTQGFRLGKSGTWLCEEGDVVLMFWLQWSLHGSGYYINMYLFHRGLEPDKTAERWQEGHVSSRAEQVVFDDNDRLRRVLCAEDSNDYDARVEYVERLIVQVLIPFMIKYSSIEWVTAYAARLVSDALWFGVARELRMARELLKSNPPFRNRVFTMLKDLGRLRPELCEDDMF